MLTHYKDLLRQYWKLVVASGLGAGALAGALSVVLLEAMPIYRSNVTLSLQPSEEALRFNDAFLGVSQLNPANIITQAHIERILSRAVVERALDILTADAPGDLADREPQLLDRLKAAAWRSWATLNYGYYEPVDPREQALADLTDAIDIEVVAGSYIMSLEVSYDDPDLAARAANALARAYIEVSGEDFAEEAAVVDAALADLQAQKETDLAAHLLRRRTLDRELGFQSLDDGRAMLLGNRTAARQAVAASERQLDVLQERLESAEETDAEALAELRARLKDSQVLAARRNEALAAAEVELETLDLTESRLAEIDQRIIEAESDLAELQSRRILTELAREARLEQVQIINDAVAPTYPAFPKVMLNAVMGVIVGMALALAPIVARDVLDDRVRTAEDLRAAVGARALPTTSRRLHEQARRYLRRGRKPGRTLSLYAEAMGRRFLSEGRPRWPEERLYVTAFGSQEDVSRLHAVTEAAARLLAPAGGPDGKAPVVVELPKLSHLVDWSPCAEATAVIGVAAGEADRAEVERAAASAREAGAAPFVTVIA